MSGFVIVTPEGFADDAWAGRTRFSLNELGGGQDNMAVLHLTADDDLTPSNIEHIINGIDPVKGINAIEITFSSAQDGRGFSLARILREYGYKGRLRAAQALTTDQYRHARQSGFDEIAITASQAVRMPEAHWKDVITLALPNYQNKLIQYRDAK